MSTSPGDLALGAAQFVGEPMAEEYDQSAAAYDPDELARARQWATGQARPSDFLFRLLADDLPDSVCVFRPDGRIVWVNRAWLAIPGEDLGLTVADVAGHRLEELLFQPEHQPALEARWAAIQSLTPDRSIVIHSFPVTPNRTQQILYKGWFESDGTPVMYVAVGRDHTVAHDVEYRLQESLRRLAESNRDLEDFARVASHDLREPLRKIATFSDRLRSTLHGLDDTQTGYLDRVESAARRMQRLIDDLLLFSRVSTQAQAATAVDLAVVVAEVVDDLEVSITESEATVDCGALPTVWADATQMRQLFQNLIANAIKFRYPDRPARVTITAAEDVSAGDELAAGGRRWRLAVADDGIGFDPRHADRIFTVFQRLHGRSEYQGSGIGLSVCRRIVERHGGSISAHSEPGAGATFTVVLPERAADLTD